MRTTASQNPPSSAAAAQHTSETPAKAPVPEHVGSLTASNSDPSSPITPRSLLNLTPWRGCVGWRREWDLNPRCPLLDTTVFETAPFGRSGIPPWVSLWGAVMRSEGVSAVSR